MTDYAAPLAPRVRRRRAEASGVVGFIRRLDWVMLGALGGLVAFGLWAIDGITRHDVAGDPEYYVVRQSIFAFIGAIGLVAALLIDPDYYRRYRKVIYALMIFLLLVVMALGADVRGSTRWIDFGFFRFQPSEFGKLLLALFLAGVLAGRGRRVGEWRTTAAVVGLAAIPTLLVFAQPDIGTALVYGSIPAAALFFAGTRWRDLGVLALIAALLGTTVLWLAPTLGVPILEQYQRDRITAFLDPTENPQGAAYNINQSITAVGAGGLDRPRRRGSNPDEPRLPARAPHRLRLRLACRAARVRRGLDPAPALPAAALARDPRDRDRARSLLRDGRRGDRLRPPVPDLRQRRDDDRDRSDHGDSAPVRQRRRLRDGHQSARDRRAPGDRNRRR